MLVRLPHRVVVQVESRTIGSGGAYTTSWTTASTDWANVQTRVLDEDYRQDKAQQYTKYKVTMRAETGITNKQRLVFEDKILVVESVGDPTNRGRMITLECREEVDN